MANLMLHRGSITVDRPTIETIAAPDPTATWFPVAHRDVLGTAIGLMEGAGFRIERTRYGLSHDGHRFFGVLDLSLPVGFDGVKLAVGVRNSTDQTFPIGLAAGTRVFVCDNLAFSAELTVTRKHTKHGMLRWTEAIGQAVNRLDQFQQAETSRIERLRETVLDPDMADAAILRAFERGIVNTRQLPAVIEQWRRPSFDWGQTGTAWHLYNAFTTALGKGAESNPQRHAGATMRLMAHFAPIIGEDGAGLMTGDRPLLDTYRDDGSPEEEVLEMHLPADRAEILGPDADADAE
jgi:hypothetical protein